MLLTWGTASIPGSLQRVEGNKAQHAGQASRMRWNHLKKVDETHAAKNSMDCQCWSIVTLCCWVSGSQRKSRLSTSLVENKDSVGFVVNCILWSKIIWTNQKLPLIISATSPAISISLYCWPMREHCNWFEWCVLIMSIGDERLCLCQSIKSYVIVISNVIVPPNQPI